VAGERNTAFVKAFEARFKRKPSYLDYDTYLSFELVHHAILKAGSAEVDAVRAALRGLKLDTAVGAVEMRAADHQLLRPIFLGQAVKVAEGRAEMVLRTTEPVERTTAPPNPTCQMPA